MLWDEKRSISSTSAYSRDIAPIFRMTESQMFNPQKKKNKLFDFKMNWKSNWITIKKREGKSYLQGINTACMKSLYVLEFRGTPRQLLVLFLDSRKRFQINKYHQSIKSSFLYYIFHFFLKYEWSWIINVKETYK